MVTGATPSPSYCKKSASEFLTEYPFQESGMPDPVQPPSLGRVVHYVLPDSSPRKGEHRSARITSVHGGDLVNLNIDYDQTDDVHPEIGDVVAQNFVGRAWSVGRDDTAGTYGTWHFPEFVPAKATPQSAPPAYIPPAPAPAPITPAASDPVSGVTDTAIPALTAAQVVALEASHTGEGLPPVEVTRDLPTLTPAGVLTPQGDAA